MKNNIVKNSILYLLFTAVCGSALAQQPAVMRTNLQQYDLSIPGKEVIQSRIDFPPKTAFGFHNHPGEEIIYVLQGTLEYQIEGQLPITLQAGQVLFIPAGVNHSAKNTGITNASELATYVVDKAKPLVTFRD